MYSLVKLYTAGGQKNRCFVGEQRAMQGQGVTAEDGQGADSSAGV